MTERWPYFLRVTLLALLYALLAWAVLASLSPNGIVSVVWPLSGLALAALLLGGKKYWPGIFIGALCGNMLAGSSFVMSIFIASGNTLEALTALWLLSRNARDYAFLTNLNSYFYLAWVAAISACISALTGCITLWVSGILTQQELASSMLQWWQGDVHGMIMFTPFILLWQHLPRDWLRREQIIETAACFGLAFLFGQIVFLGWLNEFLAVYARGFWMFIFIVWSAVRFGRHGASLLTVMIAFQAILSPILQVGFFAADIAQTGLTNYWVYTLALTMVGMALATLVDEREQAAEKLRKLSMVVEATGNPVVITDPQGVIEYTNPAFSRITGYSADEVLGKTSNLLSSGFTSAETYRSLWGQLLAGKEWRGEILNRKKSGEPLWESQTISVLRNEQGDISHFVAIKEDITARKQAEENLRHSHDELTQTCRKLRDAQAYLLQAEKMTSIGQLAAGVAHEINNPIGFIYSNLTSLEAYLGDLFNALDMYQQAAAACAADPEMAANLQRMQQELDLDFLKQDIPVLMNESREGILRVKNIVQSLREFAQLDTTEDWHWENLHRCLDNTLNVLQGALPSGIEIVKKYGELPEIECMPAQLNQMFMNLLLNAAQATEGRGCIRINSGCETEQVWVWLLYSIQLPSTTGVSKSEASRARERLFVYDCRYGKIVIPAQSLPPQKLGKKSQMIEPK